MKRVRFSLTCLVMGSFLFSSQVVFGQDQDTTEDSGETEQSETADSRYELDDVTVTVERRSQSLQDVSSLVQSFTEDDLKISGVGSELRNLQAVVPGLNIANQEGNVEIFIRGVGTSNNTELGDPSAATHINGVYLPRPRGLGAMFYDLERVEVLKGPQGTLRGRNAVAGTLNIITKKPELYDMSGFAEVGFGNYDSTHLEGAWNVPVGDTFAFRVAGFAEMNDSTFDNAGNAQHLRAAGEEDEKAVRLSALWQPTDQFELFYMGDYLEEGGTGYPGSNMFSAFTAGFDFDQVDPRQVVYRGWQGDMDSTHFGHQLNMAYDFDSFSMEYSGSYRELDFNQTNAQNDGIAYPGRDLNAVDYDNWGNVWWYTGSKSQVHELRFLSPDDSRARWIGGLFYFDEDQETGFFSTADNGYCCYSGTEFTMPDVDGTSYAAFGDLTYDVTDVFRLKGGLRYTEEDKSRYGIGGNWALAAGGDDFACCFRTRFSTPGFMPSFLSRPYFDASDRSQAGLAALLLSGMTPGMRDTLAAQLAGVVDGTMPNGTCLSDPALNNGFVVCPPDGTHSFLAITAPDQQFGTYSDDFVDWRVGAEWDYSERNMFYGSITTGHKSGGFNDTVANPDYDPSLPEGDGNPRLLNAVEFKPEKLIAYEIGSKNQFDTKYGWATFNASAFYYDYQDQVFQVLSVVGGTDAMNVGFSQQNINIADSKITGLELEGSVPLDYGFTLGGNLLWLDTEIQEGVVSDVRATNFGDLAATPDASLVGNELPKAPDLTVILKLQQYIGFDNGGSFDWQILANYTSSYYLSIFNEQDVLFDDDGDGIIDRNESARDLGFHDRQSGYTTLNIGAGYTSPSGAFRVEGYVANLLNEDASNKAILGPNLNLRFLNDPRTYGLRFTYRF